MDMIEYFKSKPVIALVGASNDPSKYGSIIFDNLTVRGYTVVPINQKHETVHGVKAFPNLAEASKQHEIGLIVYVIPPEQTKKSLSEARDLNLKRVWLQPGATNSSVAEFLGKNGFEFINACVLVEGR